MNRIKMTKEESQQMCDMFNWASNESVMPLMARVSVSIYPYVNNLGAIDLMYEVAFFQDTRRSEEISEIQGSFYKTFGTGNSLSAAMDDISSKLELLK